MSERKMIQWSPEKLQKLKVAYCAAKDQGKKSFLFNGDEFVVDYAKYLIEYLEGEFSRFNQHQAVNN
jgi:hypothetical protein